MLSLATFSNYNHAFSSASYSSGFNLAISAWILHWVGVVVHLFLDKFLKCVF